MRKSLSITINRKKRETLPVPANVTKEVEVHIIALACSEPPEGYSNMKTISISAMDLLVSFFTEPLSGWRYADSQERRTRQDWAKQI